MRKILGLETKNVDDLTVAPTNNRKHLPDPIEFQCMVASVNSTNGIEEPIIINTKNQIVSGQLRWLASKKLGINEVPVIIVEFANEIDERVVSMIQDYVRTPLTDSDKGEFITVMTKTGLGITKISEMTGIPQSTLYVWAKSTKIPEQIKDDPSLTRLYIESEAKKKSEVQQILSQDNARNLVNVPDLIHEMPNLTSRELQNMKKEVSRGVPVDVSKRVERLQNKEGTQLLNYQLEAPIYELLIKAAKMKNKEVNTVLDEYVHDGLRKDGLLSSQ